MEAEMERSQMSDAVSIKSRADDIMNEVMAEEESKYS